LTTLREIIYESAKERCSKRFDIDIDIANVLGQKYRYHTDISKGDIDPALIQIYITMQHEIIIDRLLQYGHIIQVLGQWSTQPSTLRGTVK